MRTARPSPLACAPLVALLLGLPGAAAASGLTTHVTITEWAIERHLPPGELRDLLEDPAVRPFARNGTMFPDGGYAIGEPYSEIAHWEPFQDLYLDWIRANHAPPWSDEAREHIAFLLGMGSHGMADQVFDGLYMERARQEDADSDWANTSMDTATDVALAAAIGGQEPPALWVPPPFPDLFAETGTRADRETLEFGQELTAGALRFVQESAWDPEQVARFRANYPWASDHIVDEGVPGAPPTVAAVVAAYWRDRWERLHGRGGMHVLGTVPPDGAWAHPTDADRVEARLAVVFSRSSDPERLQDAVVVTDEAGDPHPIAHRLFYGRNSHVLLLIPEADWAEDASYTVTVRADLESIEGSRTEGEHRVTFHTGPAPEPPPPGEEPSPGCAASGRSGGPAALLLLPWLAAGRRRRRVTPGASA